MGDWGSTGKSLPNLTGGYTMPPGNNGSLEARTLLANIIAVLYSCVGSAQAEALIEDREKHAVHQMVLANSALAAGEADAFLTLVSAGLEGPGGVHLRAIAELAIRIALCVKHPDLALKLYESWGPSWEKLVKAQIPEVEFDAETNSLARDMRQIEKSREFMDARAAVVSELRMMSDMEWAMWSKRSHGDIYALVQVSVNLANRTSGDVRQPILAEVPFGVAVEIWLSRAIGNLIVILTHLVATFEITVPQEVLTGFAERYERLLAGLPKLPSANPTASA